MADGLRFHLLLLPDVPWSDLRDRFRWAESCGFDSAGVGDHFCNWADPPGYWLEAWTSLAAVAAETSTIRLSTLVAQIPLRPPAILAHQAVTVDQISGGRLDLGLGTGIDIDPSYDMVGLPNWTPAERVDRFGEYVELLDLLLRQPVTSYEGTYYRADAASMNPSSTQQPRIPLTVAALGPRMMAHAARWADTWNTMSFDPDFDAQLREIRARAEAMDAMCEAIGRDPATLRRSCLLFDAEARAGGGRIRYYDDPGLFVDLATSLAGVGIDEVGLYYPAVPDQLGSVQQLASEVFPDLRSR